jgi:hypothetical protein
MPLLTTRGLGRAGNSGPTMDFVSITPNNLALAILFTDQVELVGNAANYANWVITTSDGQPVAAVSVEPSGNSVILGTTPHTTGATYTLTIPQGVMSINTGASYPAPTHQDYIGNGAGPGITRATSLDARTLQIVFNEPVLKGDAINPGNYTVNGQRPGPGLLVRHGQHLRARHLAADRGARVHGGRERQGPGWEHLVHPLAEGRRVSRQLRGVVAPRAAPPEADVSARRVRHERVVRLVRAAEAPALDSSAIGIHVGSFCGPPRLRRPRRGGRFNRSLQWGSCSGPCVRGTRPGLPTGR